MSLTNADSESDMNFQEIFQEYCKDYHDQPYVPAIIPEAPDVIIALGDIHGDFGIAIEMLNAAKLIKYNSAEDDYDWTGLPNKKVYLVQVGDQVDRCRPIRNGEFGVSSDPDYPCYHPKATENDEDSDVRLLKLFNRLDRQARRRGDMVISLLGNHEILNSQGYLNYVSYKGLKGFDNYVDPKSGLQIKDGMKARAYAFSPGKEYGMMLGCTRYPAVIIGSNIFVHAGLIDGFLEEMKSISGKEVKKSDIESINIKVRKWLLGLIHESTISHILESGLKSKSPFWTRVLGMIKPGMSLDSSECFDHLDKTLKIFSPSGNGSGDLATIIVGHTPQSFIASNDINSTCLAKGKGKVWRVDNGSSGAFDKFDSKYLRYGIRSRSRRVQYLKIINDNDFYICDAEKCVEEKIE